MRDENNREAHLLRIIDDIRARFPEATEEEIAATVLREHPDVIEKFGSELISNEVDALIEQEIEAMIERGEAPEFPDLDTGETR